MKHKREILQTFATVFVLAIAGSILGMLTAYFVILGLLKLRWVRPVDENTLLAIFLTVTLMTLIATASVSFSLWDRARKRNEKNGASGALPRDVT
jgi:hypothetical protein